jgi:hypothetical protein
VASVLAGTSTRYDALELVSPDADAILAALGVERPADAKRMVLAPDAATLTTDLAKNRKRLAFLRADDVTPAVRALAWGSKALFGGGRVASLADWPLVARLAISGPGVGTQPSAGPGYDPARAWTLVAGGDIMLDRGVAQTVKIKGKGVDFPFDGGTVEITGRCKDCSPMGWDLPYTKRTGNAGAVRSLIKGADIAIANFENPAPDTFRYHTKGTVFSADPRLIDGLKHAGIDYVSLANNHIRDAGGTGILQTIANLRERGLAYSGAGANLAAARKRRRRAPAARSSRPPPCARTSPRRARPARTSSSSSRTGARSTTRPRSPASRSWRRRASTPAQTWSSATMPTGPARWRSTRASRSGTRSAISCSIRRGPSRRWRGSRSS